MDASFSPIAKQPPPTPTIGPYQVVPNMPSSVYTGSQVHQISPFSPNPTLDSIANQGQQSGRSPAQFQSELNYFMPGSGQEAQDSMGIIGAQAGANGLGGNAAALGGQGSAMQGALQERYNRYYGNLHQNMINNLNLMTPYQASQNQMQQLGQAGKNAADVYALQAGVYNQQQSQQIANDANRNQLIGGLFNGAGMLGGFAAGGGFNGAPTPPVGSQLGGNTYTQPEFGSSSPWANQGGGNYSLGTG